MSENSTLSEIFLGLGGRAAQGIGTCFTAAGSLYAINKSSGHGIYILERLPYWMGLKQDLKYIDQHGQNYYSDQQQLDNNTIIPKNSILNEMLFYLKIGLVIGGGILIRKLGAWSMSDSTAKIFNSFVYRK